MKKAIFIALLLVVAATLIAEESTMFVKTVPIKRVYPHRLGYRVLYLKANLDFEEFFVPLKWANFSGGKAEIFIGDAPSFPYFSVFYKDGEFSYIRLYLHESRNHETWGVMKLSDDYDDKFEDESLNLVFE